MLGDMANLTCPACGLSFETTATTNTRCRHCRKVVNIGASQRRAARAELGDSYCESADDAATGDGGGALALIGVLAALGLGWWWASRSAKGPDEAQQPQLYQLSVENPFETPEI